MSVMGKNAWACCVCKARNVGLHVHHIDSDPSNNAEGNLAVLCVCDHDRHHRPTAYTVAKTKHLELSAEAISGMKRSWESFVEEARRPAPRVLATISCYGTNDSLHSAKLVLQREDGTVEFERIFHLLAMQVESWPQAIIEQVSWLNRRIPVVLINEPLEPQYCPCCNSSFSNTLQGGAARKVTKRNWSDVSTCAVYINPTFPSIAVLVQDDEGVALQAHLHRCGNALHLQSTYYEERTFVHRGLSVRHQAKRIVRRILAEWKPGEVFIGTGDAEAPQSLPRLILPACWEGKTPRRVTRTRAG